MSSTLNSGKTVDRPAKPPHVLESAGRAFRAKFGSLSAGEKAVLRRADPFMARSFWKCVEAARKATDEPDRVSKYEGTLAAMVPLLPIKDGQDSGKNLGATLRSAGLVERRVEMIFTESRMTPLIEQIESAATISKMKLDFGVLLRDLVDFMFHPADVRRRWARSYFNTN